MSQQEIYPKGKGVWQGWPSPARAPQVKENRVPGTKLGQILDLG